MIVNSENEYNDVEGDKHKNEDDVDEADDAKC